MSESSLHERIANTPTRSQKTSWARKMSNMLKLLADAKPINEEIEKLEITKRELHDNIESIRQQMIYECVHPLMYLESTDHDRVVQCTFCNRRIRVSDANE